MHRPLSAKKTSNFAIDRADNTYESVRRVGVLGKQSSTVLESILELTRVNSIPNWPHSTLRYTTGQTELRSH